MPATTVEAFWKAASAEKLKAQQQLNEARARLQASKTAD